MTPARQHREDEPEYTVSLDRQIDRARREMGESKWQRLNAEWADIIGGKRHG